MATLNNGARVRLRSLINQCRIPGIFVLLALASISSACQRNASREEAVSTTSQVQLGAPLFKFDPLATTELLITKNDPTSGDRWTLRLSRLGDSPEWRITSAPDGRTLIDRHADGGLIRHLLDTLGTLRPDELAPKGPHSSFGLENPYFALRWTEGGITRELRIGDAAKTRDSEGSQESPVSSDTPFSRYALAIRETGDPGTPVLVVRGAALQMLGYLKSMETLRLRTLLPITSDDVDELELRQKGREILYAQRGRGDWVDRKQKLFKARALPVGEGLEQITHLRIKRFIDDPAEKNRQARVLKNPADFHFTFKDRFGKPTDLRISHQGGSVWATVSSRPDAIFELHPESLRILGLMARRGS